MKLESEGNSNNVIRDCRKVRSRWAIVCRHRRKATIPHLMVSRHFEILVSSFFSCKMSEINTDALNVARIILLHVLPIDAQSSATLTNLIVHSTNHLCQI